MKTKKITSGRLVIRDCFTHIAETPDGMSTIFEAMQPAPIGINDAKRLVLCWNLCDGIGTEDLREMDNQLISMQSLINELSKFKSIA